MTREELIKAIYDNNEDWSCNDRSCYNSETESVFDSCLKCSEKQLAEYENKIKADERKRFAEWCKLKGYGHYDWRMLIEQYEEENNE